ncbi:MAG: HNH endonuclease [Planctomycetes bacterium]|nr:HNH endonuclease [Planctomycetota bacterium]
MTIIQLTRGMVATIDDGDAELVQRFTWHADKARSTWYAQTTLGRGKTLRMHRLIMVPPPGLVVDHINGNGLDNRRANLRVVTPAVNAMNSPARGKSRFRGVTWYHPKSRKTGRWEVRVKKDGVVHSCGYFESEIEAALAYDVKARELYGSDATLNFPAAIESATRHLEPTNAKA